MNTDMQTPISHGGHSREASVASMTSRPRGYSDASLKEEQAAALALSPASPPPSEEQLLSVVQHGERQSPPRNQHHQFICNFSEECKRFTFNRKCEWSKHMDKHDRPYRCLDPICAKLQGFTYSGGLLRHEREVHGKHGGPKEKLQCPYEDCKRHTGNGFTRKENRDEHVRRVHLKKKDDPLLKLDANMTNNALSPASEVSMASPTSASVLGKRKTYASMSPERSESDREDLKAEIRRLRQQNDDLRDRLSRLENEQRLDPGEFRGTAATARPFRAA